MGPVAAAIVFGIGSFGVAKMSGASTRNALIAGNSEHVSYNAP